MSNETVPSTTPNGGGFNIIITSGRDDASGISS